MQNMYDSKVKALEGMDNSKLIDVVKNYRQYGYEEILRDTAIKLLKSRGVDMELLNIKGALHNPKYELAGDLYDSYISNSRAAYIMYIAAIVLPFLMVLSNLEYSAMVMGIRILNIGLSILYIVFVIKALMNQNEFYKALGKEVATGDLVIYVIIGMPFYVIFYFIYKKQMGEEMKTIQ